MNKLKQLVETVVQRTLKEVGYLPPLDQIENLATYEFDLQATILQRAPGRDWDDFDIIKTFTVPITYYFQLYPGFKGSRDEPASGPDFNPLVLKWKNPITGQEEEVGEDVVFGNDYKVIPMPKVELPNKQSGERWLEIEQVPAEHIRDAAIKDAQVRSAESQID